MPDAGQPIALIDDDDIAWISKLMNLKTLDEPRRRFLRHLGVIDVAACPGSGKTTLVVAKLAILARHWQSASQGVCVLSHTNVAREEIQRRLTGSEVGDRLHRYPHYVDTIHGFANRFLALPWLASKGVRVTSIDDAVASAFRIRNLGQDRFAVKALLERRYSSIDSLRLGSSNLADPAVHDFPAGPDAKTYKAVAAALRASVAQGYFRHDEMIMFAQAMLDEHPEVVSILSRRFPIVLIDEMQDTSADQLRLLNGAFDGMVSVQRVGDPNQAIYSRIEEDESGSAVAFPAPERERISIPNSFRFDASIAAFADGLAVTAVEPDGLKGVRVDSRAEARRHTVFVFPQNDPSKVLRAFAEHVLSEVADTELSTGSVHAVGHVHKARDIDREDPKFPASVAHYMAGYRQDFRGTGTQPPTLVDCIRKARAMLTMGSKASDAIDVAATGFITLINRSSENAVLRMGSRPHRSLERALVNHAVARATYRTLLARFVVGDDDLTQAAWTARLPDVKTLVAALAGQLEVSDYARWTGACSNGADEADFEPGDRINIFRHEVGGRALDVQLGTIHSVKGQTHTATLLLETHHHQHVLKALVPWLSGNKSGASGAGVQQLGRLRLAYVAMTRPIHLLCLAMPESSLGGDSVKRLAAREALSANGWSIIDVS